MPPEHRPGDHILDRYMRGASEEARETARAYLYRLVRLIIRVNERLMVSNPQVEIRAPEHSGLESESPSRV